MGPTSSLSMLLSSPPPSLRPPTSSPRRIPSRSRPLRIGSDPMTFSLYPTRNVHPPHLSSSTTQNSDADLHHSQFSYPVQPLSVNLRFRRDPLLGLASLLFVISMVMGSFISVAIVSIPALSSLRKLKISMDKLSKVVSEEVPGTLSSLKLSSLEINDLTDQLKNLRQNISGNKYEKKPRAKPRSRGGSNPIIY